MTELSAYRNTDLQEILRIAKQPTSGNKETLVKRIEDFFSGFEEEVPTTLTAVKERVQYIHNQMDPDKLTKDQLYNLLRDFQCSTSSRDTKSELIKKLLPYISTAQVQSVLRANVRPMTGNAIPKMTPPSPGNSATKGADTATVCAGYVFVTSNEIVTPITYLRIPSEIARNLTEITSVRIVLSKTQKDTSVEKVSYIKEDELKPSSNDLDTTSTRDNEYVPSKSRLYIGSDREYSIHPSKNGWMVESRDPLVGYLMEILNTERPTLANLSDSIRIKLNITCLQI